MESDTLVRRNSSIVFQRFAADGGGVLLHLETDAYHNLNATGVLVWDLLENPLRVSDLADRFCARFEEDGETARDDLLAFLEELVERDLIVMDGSAVEGARPFGD